MRGKFHRSGIGSSHPYSLIEMLMVLAIIAILVGLGAGGYSVGRRWAAQSRTEALLAKIKLALESYKNDKGYYPLPQNNTAVNFRLDANLKDFFGTKPTSKDHLQPRNNMSAHMDFGKLRADQSLKVKENHYYKYFLKDGWNSPVDGTSSPFGPNVPCGPIKYRCPGLINKTSFDLYSAGPDRKFATKRKKISKTIFTQSNGGVLSDI